MDMNAPIPIVAEAVQNRSFSTTGRNCEVALSGPGEIAGRAALAERRSKIRLRPWDGVALVESVLAEAQQAARVEREVAVTSSPRVNPALLRQDVVENTETMVQRFMLNLAKELPRAAAASPAMLAAQAATLRSVPQEAERLADDVNRVDEPAARELLSPARGLSSPHGTARSATKHLIKHKTTGSAATGLSALLALRTAQQQQRNDTSALNLSSSFASPQREGLEKPRAPPVGQYNPRINITSRRGTSAAISRAPRPGFASDEDLARSLARAHRGTKRGHHHGGASSSYHHQRAPVPVAAQQSVQTTLSATASGAASPTYSATMMLPAGMAGSQRATDRDPLLATVAGLTATRGSRANLDEDDTESDAQRARAHQLRIGTPQFLSRTERFAIPERASAKADRESFPAWPTPTPGSRPATAGTFSQLAKVSSFDAMHTPSVISFVQKDSTTKMPCFVTMRTSTNRENHTGQKHLYGAEPTPQRPLTPADITVLSTARRAPSPMSFVHMASRPPTPVAPDRPVLAEARLDPPRGFVDIRRMVYDGERTLVGDPAAEARGAKQSELHPNYESVMRRAPSPIIGSAAVQSAFASAPPRPSTSQANRAPSPVSLHHHHSMPPRPSSTPPGTWTDDSVAILNPSVGSVRRRAPAISMVGTGRDAPVMRENRDQTPSTFYNTDVPPRVSSPNIGGALSRVKRELRYKQARAVDAIYDMPAEKAHGGVLSFAHNRPRK
jgi:hypothetical protein